MSVVVYLDDHDESLDALFGVIDVVDREFANYELVLVDDGISSSLSSQLDAFRKDRADSRVTVVSMGKKQGLEKSMNAGIDCAVGDFVLEVDDIGTFDPMFLIEAYEKAVTDNNDIVFGESRRPSLYGAFFYPIFNRVNGSEVNLNSGSCRLVSRRAINRVRAMAEYMPYRKAAYASSGLSTSSLLARSKATAHRTGVGVAVDSLAIYTDFFYKVSTCLAIVMMLLSCAELVYTLVVFFEGRAIEGWSTIMLVISFGLFGLFALLAFILKYLSLLVKSVFHKTGYFVESVKRL